MYTEYSIFALVDPRDNTIHYVGVTGDPSARIFDMVDKRVGSLARNQWLTELKQLNIRPLVRILEDKVDKASATERKYYWIQKFLNDGEPLTNVRVTPNDSTAIYRVGWVSMQQAAKALRAEGYKTDPNKISRLARKGLIQTREDILDIRARLVSLDELRKLYDSSPQRSRYRINDDNILDDENNER